MRIFQIYAIFAISAFIWNCSTTHHINPGRPLKKGETFTSINLIIPFHNFEMFSLQFDNYIGIGNETNFGFSISELMLVFPTTVSLSKYQKIGDGYLGYNIYLNNLFERSYNPVFETGLSYSNIIKNHPQNIYIGVGYYTPFSWLHKLLKAKLHNFKSNSRIAPIFETELGYENYGLSLRYNGNLTNYYIEYYNQGRIKMKKDPEPNEDSLIVLYDDIEIIDTVNLKQNEKLIITLKDGTKIKVRDRDPYADCHGCAIRKKLKRAYLSGDNHDVYWLIYPNHFNSLLEFSLKDVVESYKNKKTIIFKEPKDIVQKKKERYNLYLENISVGVNYSEYYD